MLRSKGDFNSFTRIQSIKEMDSCRFVELFISSTISLVLAINLSLKTDKNWN